MNCPNCQTENLKPGKFCRECGARLVMICGFCGCENRPHDKFCGDCARQLKGDLETKDIRSKIESERKNVTVLFSDLSEYTRLTEKLDPEEVKKITHQIFSNITGIIVKYEGFVERVFGDEVLAYFGVPKSYEDHPLRAILAAREIHDLVKCMSLEFEEETGQTLRMHTGIDTGLVVTGNTDVAKGQDGFSGQTINIASRLADMAGPDEILIGHKTFYKTESHFIFEPVTLNPADLKRSQAAIYRVIGIRSSSMFDLGPEQKLAPFVGRVRELGRLQDFFGKSQSGRPLAVSIVSKPGEGKSRLLHEFRNSITNQKVTFLESKCYSFHLNTAYFPIIELLKINFNIQQQDSNTVIAQKVKKGMKSLGLHDPATIPYLLQLLSGKDSITTKAPLNLEELKGRIAYVVKQMIIRSSDVQPVVIAVEDLHWIDKSSEEYIEEMLKDLPDAKVLFILTYRSEYLPPWKNTPQIHRIDLKPLTKRDSLILVKNLLRTKRLESDLARLILEKAGGVPFFIEEFIRSLLDRKGIEKKGESSRLAKDLHSMAIPLTIQDIIAARIDSLPKGAKDLIQKGSIAGKVFSYDLIKRVAGVPEEDLLIYLSVLRQSQLLYLKRVDRNSLYHFKHSLTQEVAYAGLLVSKRKEIHNKVAAAIEKIHHRKLDPFFEVLAHHYASAENSDKAYRYLVLSGKKATARYSNREAYHFFKTAAELFSIIPDNDDSKRKKIEALKLAIIPMVRLGYPEDSLRILNEGEDLSKDVKDLKSLANFYDLIGNYYTAKGGDPLMGVKYSEKCLKEVEKVRDYELLARAARGLCGSYIVLGEPLKSANLSGKVIDIIEHKATQNDLPVAGASVLAVLKALYGHSQGWLGNFAEGRRWAEKALRFGQHTDNFYDLAYIHFLCGYLYMHAGEGEMAIEHFDRCIHYCEEGKVLLWMGLGWTGLGMGYFFSEDLKSARKYILKGTKLQKDSNIPYYLSFHLLALGLVSYESKELRRAKYYLGNSLKLSEKYSEKWIEGVSKTFLGSLLSKIKKNNNQAEESEALIRQGIEILNERKILPWATIGYYLLGQFYTANGNPEKAFANLNRAEVLFNEMNMHYWLKRTRNVLKTL